MSLGDRLKELRNKQDLTQKELAQKIGCSHQSISKYENDENMEKIKVIQNLSEYFAVSTDYLIKGIVSEKLGELTVNEEQFLSKYRNLTSRDKEIVDYIMNRKQENIKPIIKYESIVTDDVIYFPLIKQKASAGIGDETHQLSNDSNRVCFPLNEVPDGVSHAIIIDGYSMEPIFFDGQIVFINAEKECGDGDFGIFQVITPEKTDVYCKQLKYDEYGRRYLHSVSERADDPEFTENSETILVCIGKIIMK